MKRKEIKKYWKEQREETTVDDGPFVEHKGGTKDSIAAYRNRKCTPCKKYGGR